MARNRVTIPKNFVSESWSFVKEHGNLYWLLIANVAVTMIAILIFVLVVRGAFSYEVTHASDALISLVISIVIMLACIICIPLFSNIVNATVIFYSNAILRENKKISLSQAFVMALKRVSSLLSWSAIQGTIGLILHFFENMSDTTANLVIDMVFGFAWGVISFFVLPIVLLDNKNPFAAIKASTAMIKDVWGKRTILRLGMFSLLITVLFFICLAIIALGIYLNDQLSFFVLATGVILLIALLYTQRLVTIVVRMKLYYAVKDGAYSAG